MMILSICASIVAMTASAGAAVPTDDGRAVSMEITEGTDHIEVLLIAQSPKTQRVAFTLNVTGASRSKHKGATTISADTRQVLSTIKVSKSGDWCAEVEVSEDDGAPYTLTQGSCTKA